MYFFAVFLFFTLGIMVLTSLVGERRLLRRLPEARALVAGGLGVGLAWLANFDMWTGWHITGLRWPWVGVTLTGLALGGTALLFWSVAAFFTGHYRKAEDEAERIERTELRKVS